MNRPLERAKLNFFLGGCKIRFLACTEQLELYKEMNLMFQAAFPISYCRINCDF